MKAKTDILSQLRKAKTPSLPTGFFDSFSSDVMHLIDLEDDTSGLLDNLVLKRFKNDLKLNLGIDEEVGSLLNTKVVEMQTEPNKKRQALLWVSGIAACFLLYFATPFLASGSEIVDTATSEELLLAYLDEDDLVDFILDETFFQKTDSLAFEDELLYEELEDGFYDYLNDLQ